MAELVVFRSKKDKNFYRGNVESYEEYSFVMSNVSRKRWAGAAVWNHVEGHREFLVRDIKKVELIRDIQELSSTLLTTMLCQFQSQVKTREALGRREILSVYLKNKKRIERLTVSIALNNKKIKGPGTAFQLPRPPVEERRGCIETYRQQDREEQL